MPIFNYMIAFAHASIGVNDRILVSMKQGQCGLHFATTVFINYWGLSKIAEVQQGADGHNKLFGSSASNGTNNVSLDVTMLLSRYLFELGNTFFEVSVTNIRV